MSRSGFRERAARCCRRRRRRGARGTWTSSNAGAVGRESEEELRPRRGAKDTGGPVDPLCHDLWSGAACTAHWLQRAGKAVAQAGRREIRWLREVAGPDHPLDDADGKVDRGRRVYPLRGIHREEIWILGKTKHGVSNHETPPPSGDGPRGRGSQYW